MPHAYDHARASRIFLMKMEEKIKRQHDLAGTVVTRRPCCPARTPRRLGGGQCQARASTRMCMKSVYEMGKEYAERMDGWVSFWNETW